MKLRFIFFRIIVVEIDGRNLVNGTRFVKEMKTPDKCHSDNNTDKMSTSLSESIID